MSSSFFLNWWWCCLVLVVFKWRKGAWRQRLDSWRNAKWPWCIPSTGSVLGGPSVKRHWDLLQIMGSQKTSSEICKQMANEEHLPEVSRGITCPAIPNDLVPGALLSMGIWNQDRDLNCQIGRSQSYGCCKLWFLPIRSVLHESRLFKRAIEISTQGLLLWCSDGFSRFFYTYKQFFSLLLEKSTQPHTQTQTLFFFKTANSVSGDLRNFCGRLQVPSLPSMIARQLLGIWFVAWLKIELKGSPLETKGNDLIEGQKEGPRILQKISIEFKAGFGDGHAQMVHL